MFPPSPSDIPRPRFALPYELSQQPPFALLGAPDDRWRHVRLDGGHIPANRAEIVREVLDWLEQQLRPARRAASGSPGGAH